MNKGKIKWYDETKGFGFIEVENGKDIFIHRSGLSDNTTRLDEGQEVEFDIKDGERGPIAINLKKIE